MKKNNRLAARFAKETRFEAPALRVANRGGAEQDLEQLKERLLSQVLDNKAEDKAGNLQLAANEAAGLAWFTPFPLLFFPALLEEKIHAAERREARQRRITRKTADLLEKAAG